MAHPRSDLRLCLDQLYVFFGLPPYDQDNAEIGSPTLARRITDSFDSATLLLASDIAESKVTSWNLVRTTWMERNNPQHEGRGGD